jgi:transposase
LIRIDAVWMATEPLDMRAGPETALARVVQVFGAAHPHHAYLFANQRATRMKVLVHDGVGVWLAARRLNTGKFAWGGCTAVAPVVNERSTVERTGSGFALATHG